MKRIRKRIKANPEYSTKLEEGFAYTGGITDEVDPFPNINGLKTGRTTWGRTVLISMKKEDFMKEFPVEAERAFKK